MANPLSSNPVAALGEAGRFTELRRRFLFLLGGLVVYRIGTFIPVPGIDPVALARDVATLSELGYELQSVRGFDLFPHTHHVEALAVLRRK